MRGLRFGRYDKLKLSRKWSSNSHEYFACGNEYREENPLLDFEALLDNEDDYVELGRELEKGHIFEGVAL